MAGMCNVTETLERDAFSSVTDVTGGKPAAQNAAV